MAGRRGQKSKKGSELPAKYQPGFADAMDGRTKIARMLRERYQALTADLGGEDSLSYQQKALVWRVLHLEGLLQGTEEALARGEKIEVGQYVQAVNALTGLLKTLGLHRKSREIDLNTYLRRKAAEKVDGES